MKNKSGMLKCEICGWGFCGNYSSVNAHHIKPVSAGGENKDDNLILLCPNHHAIAHFISHTHKGKYSGPSSKQELIDETILYEKSPELLKSKHQRNMTSLLGKMFFSL